jgi:membrane protein
MWSAEKSDHVPHTVPDQPGWKLISRILGRGFSQHNIPTIAAGVTLFVLIALFPALAVLFSLYQVYGDTRTLFKGLDQVSSFLPDGGVTILKAELSRLSRGGHHALSWGFLVNLLVALWSASGAYTALVAGLDAAYQLTERRSLVRLTFHGICFAAIAVAVAIGGAMLLSPFLSMESSAPFFKLLLDLLSWPAAYLSSFIAIALIYRFVPDHPHGGPHGSPWAAGWLHCSGSLAV